MADSELAVVLKLKDQITKPIASVASKVLSALGGAFSKTASAIFNVTRFIDHLTNVAKKMIGEFLKFGQLANELAPDAQKFIPNLTSEDESRVKQVAEAYNRLIATLKGFMGHGIASFRDDIVGVLDSISEFLNTHKEEIISFIRNVVDAVRELATLMRAFANNRFGFGDLFSLGGKEKIAAGLSAQRLDDSFSRFNETVARVSGFQIKVGSPDINTQFQATLQTLEKMGPDLSEIAHSAEDAADAAGKLAAKCGNEDGALTASIDGATAALNKFKPKLAEVPSLAAEAQRVLVQLSEVAQTMADQMTDAFFAIIEKTKSVTQAITEMVTGIIKDIGRMLLNRALMQLLSGLLGATDSGGAFTGIFGNNSPAGGGHASGGPVGAGRWTMVGERGPELVRFGSSARVYNASDSAQMAGGPSIVVNVSGGMSPAEVRRQARLGVLEGLQTSTQFRHQLRGNA